MLAEFEAGYNPGFRLDSIAAEQLLIFVRASVRTLSTLLSVGLRETRGARQERARQIQEPSNKRRERYPNCRFPIRNTETVRFVATKMLAKQLLSLLLGALPAAHAAPQLPGITYSPAAGSLPTNSTTFGSYYN